MKPPPNSTEPLKRLPSKGDNFWLFSGTYFALRACPPTQAKKPLLSFLEGGANTGTTERGALQTDQTRP